MTVTFGRLAVIDYELGMDVIVYLFTVLCGFARWSILDVAILECRWMLVTCIISCIGSGIFETGFFEMPDVCGVQSCTAIHRVPRRRMGERSLDIEVSCEISGFRPDE